LAKLKSTRLAALPDLAPEALELTGEITAAVDAGIAEAREAVATMRLGGEGQESLRELLSRTLADFEDRFGLAVEFECESELATPPPRALAETLRITHEALTNVRRHADATVVRVRGAVDERAGAEVHDNGGLIRAVNDRVRDRRHARAGRLIGGELQVESAQHKGTRGHPRCCQPAPHRAPVAVS
jgi:signal transduction histidine kinase